MEVAAASTEKARRPAPTAGPGALQRGSSRWSILWAVGMLAIFVGERMIGSGGSRTLATTAGLVMVIGAMAARFVRAGGAAADRRKLEQTLLALYAVGLGAVVLYVAQSDLWASAFKQPLERNWPKLSTVLAALWPVAWVAAAWPILLVELAYAEIARAPRLELGRIRSAMLSGLGIAAAMTAVFSFAYVSSERDKKLDLAYFRTSRPGEVTRRIVRNLDQQIEVAVFFPSSNEVRDQVDDYLTDLAKESGQLKITHFDYDIDPVKAKDYGVTTNGILVFVRGAKREQLGLPKDIEGAKSGLKTLDKEVQQRLLTVVKPPRAIGFTLGHGERTWERGETDTDKRVGIALLRDGLIDQNYTTRSVNPSDGLMNEIPKDVTVLAIIGPRKPFLPEELASINRFIDGGGRVLIALDPENNIDMHEVLGPLNLIYKAEPLANEMAYARRMEQKISDRANLVTSTFSSHPSVTTLQRLGPRASVVLPGAGWIDTKKDRTAAIPVDSPIKAHYATFVDKNGNFAFDPDEQKRQWEVAATAVKKDARVFVIADSDWIADEAIKVPGNSVLALDVIHWLMGDEAFSGQTSTEADVKITHTRKQDVAWFYTTIFLVPAAVIGLGVIVTRSARRKRRQEDAKRKGPAAPKPLAARGDRTRGVAMTGRGLAVQSGIAALGLVTVYATWQRDPERAPGAVTVIDASKSDVTKVHFEDETLAVDLARGPSSDQSGVWLHLVMKKAENKPDPHSPAKPDAKPAALPPPRDLPGADNAKHLFEQFAPLVSMRAFGVLDAGKLKDLGLDNPKRKLEVTVKGDVRRYDIGTPGSQAAGESFIRDVRDGRVYLMPRNVLTELQNAGHMVNSRLHTFDLPDFDSIKLASGGKQKEFVQVGRESRSTMGFAPAKTPDKKDQMAKNWHDALWRVFATEQLGKGEEPTGAKVSIVLRVDYYEGKNSVGWTEIGRAETGSGLTDDAAPGGEVYARTEHTAGWSKIPSGGQLIPDAQKLIAAP